MKKAIAAALLAGMISPVSAIAQNVESYPARDVTIIVPFAPGGGVDTVARPIAESLRRQFKRAFIIENRAGAATNLGTGQVAHSDPDGQTLLINLDIISAYPYLYTLKYDPSADLTPVGYIASAPMVVAVHPSLPVNSVAELVALAKKDPSKLTFANPGLGTPHHLAFELLEREAGFKIRTAGYRGGGPALTDVLGGHVQIGVFTVATVTSFIETGKLKALAVTSPKRAAVAPQIPTMRESGFPASQVTNQYIMMAPAKTPAPIIEKLNAALAVATKDPEVTSLFKKQGFDVLTTTPAEAAALFASERKRWEAVFKDAGIRLN